ncbi:hypothetical protein [Nocardia donostiensis]|uniref:Uncharacterized protein n=1 Tax=Nocardia donostiensis TaxID=1538463 RepID=A0A1V2TD35_9NOCA|nr:hypothetical protein [Nocardia donostiensis]ONM47251.1 hypothetical protein B0T46_18400 [Nocardia donostiensis]OQS16556.1 hypothetical protein B0T36_02365 [Nocardia donostiensis]OQS21030.1 hypothetical protein B0T44_08330 [Nocardia donostiensis]
MSTNQAAVEFPVEKLTEPQISDPYPDLLELIINGNGISLTYHINNLVAIITGGFNPLQTITDNVSGNWSALQKSADAIRKLADYNSAYHQALDSAMGIAEQSWKGNAADDARQFFTTLTDALDAQVGPPQHRARTSSGSRARAQHHRPTGAQPPAILARYRRHP